MALSALPLRFIPARRHPGTNQHGKGHQKAASNQRDPPSQLVNKDGFKKGAADLECRLDAASHQTEPGTQPEYAEQGREVVLHGRGATHLRHELQKRRPPQPPA